MLLKCLPPGICSRCLNFFLVKIILFYFHSAIKCRWNTELWNCTCKGNVFNDCWHFYKVWCSNSLISFPGGKDSAGKEKKVSKPPAVSTKMICSLRFSRFHLKVVINEIYRNFLRISETMYALLQLMTFHWLLYFIAFANWYCYQRLTAMFLYFLYCLLASLFWIP